MTYVVILHPDEPDDRAVVGTFITPGRAAIWAKANLFCAWDVQPVTPPFEAQTPKAQPGWRAARDG